MMKNTTITTAIAGALLLAAAGPLSAQDYSIDWFTIDAGGTLESEGGDWKLSGTIGQWDATEGRELSGGDWHVTGGFWGMTLEELADLLFRDRFEQDESS